jgi:hypothetical protein
MFLMRSVCIARGLCLNDCFHVQYYCLYPCLPVLSNNKLLGVKRQRNFSNLIVEQSVLYTRSNVSQTKVFRALGQSPKLRLNICGVVAQHALLTSRKLHSRPVKERGLVLVSTLKN